MRRPTFSSLARAAAGLLLLGAIFHSIFCNEVQLQLEAEGGPPWSGLGRWEQPMQFTVGIERFGRLEIEQLPERKVAQVATRAVRQANHQRNGGASRSQPEQRVTPHGRLASAHLAESGHACRLPHRSSHMATNLAIDPDLLERALEVSGERTKRAAVTKALQEFIARREQQRMLDLMGKLEWDPSCNYKAERSRR